MPALRRPSRSRWLVYLLRCSDGSLYTGITNDLPKRLKAHAAGKASRYTRSRLPVKLAYSESQRSKSAALKRELAIKKLRRAEKEKLGRNGDRRIQPAKYDVAAQEMRSKGRLRTRSASTTQNLPLKPISFSASIRSLNR
ncbi:MAG: GIY-YIG nuclease family protein [Planctomycetota bacterium]